MPSLSARCSRLVYNHRVEAFGRAFHVPDRDQLPGPLRLGQCVPRLSLLHFQPDAALEEPTTRQRYVAAGELANCSTFFAGSKVTRYTGPIA